jgi:hypothetical protein
MTVLENHILQALRDLDNTARNLRVGTPKPAIGDILARIDDLTSQLPRGTDPELLHFLHRKSYQKALEFLSAMAQSSEP